MNDQDLVRQVLNGNAKAFEMLVEMHQRLVSHMVGRIVQRKEDHEEMCQDVFMRVYDRLDEFNFQSKLSTWIGTIAYRMSLNFIKKKDILSESEDDLNHIKIGIESVEDNYIQIDSSDYINKLIMQLPVNYRTVLTLYHLEDMKYPEIVEITGWPEGTVKNYLFRARKLLKDKLDVFLKKEEL